MKQVMSTTGWAVMNKNAEHPKAIFRGVEAATAYAQWLNGRLNKNYTVYPWTIPADLFDCD